MWLAILSGDVRLCVTTEILNEYHEVLTIQTSSKVADNVLTLLTKEGMTEFFSPTFRFNIITSDPDDNKFVDCAIVAQARCIVSNDRHFDEARACRFPAVDVQTLEEFAGSL